MARNHRRRLAKFPLRQTMLFLALSALALTAASADDDASRFKFEFNGYATLGFVHSDEEQADFLGSLLIENGAGFTNAWSAEVDSRVGAQLTATFGEKLSAVVQMVAEQRADGEYTPHLEWANLKYQVTPEASVRVGRIVLPSFLVSDFRKVGYANPWVRPPNEVYALVPVTTSDGIDGSYRLSAGAFTNTLQAYYGQSDFDLPNDDSGKGRNSWGLTATTDHGDLSVRLAYLRTGLHIDSLNTLFDAFRQFGPEGIAIADEFDTDGSLFQFLSAGAQYDPGNWFMKAEWGRGESHSVLGERAAWYASGGYRFARFTPYLTYSTVSAGSARSHPGLTVAAYPPALAPIAAGLNAALNGILASNPSQDTLSIGVRWDFMQNLDLKLQYDHSRLGSGSAGDLGNVQTGFTPGGTYNLVSIALDIVF